MRTEFQKNIINGLEEKLTDQNGFNWEKLAELILKGGLPKQRKASRFKVDQFYAFTKKTNDLPNAPVNRSTRYSVSESPVLLDLYHHPRYLSLEFLREVFKDLQRSRDILDLDDNFLFQMVELKKKIRLLERDLNIDYDEVVIPGKYNRFLPHLNYKTDKHFKIDSINPPIKVKDKFYINKSLKPASFFNYSPYSVGELNDIGRISKKKQQPNKMLDPSYWSLIYNKTIDTGPSFLNSFRRFTEELTLRYSKKIKTLRKNSLLYLVKSLRQHLQQVVCFKNFYLHRQELLGYKFNFFSTEFKSFYPEKTPFNVKSLNVLIYYVKGYWRSPVIAQINREYILTPSKRVPLKYKFKIDIPSKNVKDFTSIEIGSFNLSKLIPVGTQTLYKPDAYSEVPTKFEYFTKHRQNKRRLKLKETTAGKKLQSIRNSVSEAIKKRLFKGPIYVEYPTKKTLSGLALYFLNYETRHHYRIKSENSEYTSKERRLFNILLNQGVIYEYWEEDPNLVLPGQRVQMYIQNIEINKEYKIKEYPPLDLDIKVFFEKKDDRKPSSKVEEEIFFNSELKIDSKLKGRFLLYFKISKFIVKFYYFFGIFYERFFYFVRRFFFELKIFFCIFYDIFEFLRLNLKEKQKKIEKKPIFLRFRALLAFWNVSSAIEDSQFDINDYISAKIEYEHPFARSFFKQHPQNPTDYADFDDDFPDDYDDVNGASRVVYNPLSGVFEFGEDFLDEFIDFFIVNIPYYLLLFFRPIINFILIYPIWAIFDLLSLIYSFIKIETLLWYDNFLNVKPGQSILLRRFVILTRWLLKSLALFVYIFGWLIFLDYNELQMLVVYTFDIEFHEIYYIIYVMFVVLSGFYFFGHHSFKAFLKDELGFENLAFLVTCTGAFTVQNYEVTPKPFNFTKELYTKTVEKNFKKNTQHPITTFTTQSTYPGARGYQPTPGKRLTDHFGYDDLEFIIDSQLWSKQLPYWVGNFPNPGLSEKYFYNSKKKGSTEGIVRFESHIHDLLFNSYFISDENYIDERKKSLKEPVTWFTSNEHYYNHLKYNRQSVSHGFDIVTYYKEDLPRTHKFSLDIANSHASGGVNRKGYNPPGKLDRQSSRYRYKKDPTTFQSYTDDL